MSKKGAWTTSDELGFIDAIGRITMMPENMKPRGEILKGYIKSCEERFNWKGMSRDVVVSYAENALEHEQGR